MTAVPAAESRFDIRAIEIKPGATTTVAGVGVTSWEVNHPSAAPALALRLDLDGKTIATTGDTAWTDTLLECSAGADLLIAEVYYRDKNIRTTRENPTSTPTESSARPTASCSPTCRPTCSTTPTRSRFRPRTTD